MGFASTALAALLLGAACGQVAGPAATVVSPSASPSRSPVATEAPVPSPSPPPLTDARGLLYVSGALDVVRGDGTVETSVHLRPSSVTTCPGGAAALLAPPVSASNAYVYVRDGDTSITRIDAGGKLSEVAQVPGGQGVVSFFSVSPDDKRIAVVVEDLTPADVNWVRLYVENIGGGGRIELLSVTVSKASATATTYWPVGWHGNTLVMAVMPMCGPPPADDVPRQWSVFGTQTGDLVAAMVPNNCNLSAAASPAGIGCTDSSGNAFITKLYDWTGKSFGQAQAPIGEIGITALSPDGVDIYYDSVIIPGAEDRSTYTIVQDNPSTGKHVIVKGERACGWIDAGHLLAPDAAITFAYGEPGSNGTVVISKLGVSGECAGRFPGGL